METILRKIKISAIILITAAVLLGGEVFASSLFFGGNFFQNKEYKSDEIIVKYKDGIENNEIENINNKFGNKIIYESKLGFKKIEIPKGADIKQMIEIYNKDSRIEYAEPDYIAQALMVPNDTHYNPYQWNLKNINMEKAWDISNGAGITVAVVDTGIAYENYREGWWKKYYQAPDLAETNFVNGYDFVNDDRHANDDNSHGTHIAGTLAQSTNNNLGVAGVAFGAKIMPIKVLSKEGSGYYSWIADGIRYAADNGAKVINLSLGGPYNSQTLKSAVDYAYNKGVVMVAATGNNGQDSVFYPAAYDKVIAVGATRYDETKTYYSNYGDWLDLMAPGGDATIDQNNDGRNDGIVQQTFSGDLDNFGYYFFQGTSCAAPHVSGIAVLLLSKNSNLSPNETKNILEQTAKDKGRSGWDRNYGWGIVDAWAALNYFSDPDPDPENISPIADAGENQTAYAGEKVSFDGSDSYDPDGEIISYEWNFGDGSFGSGKTVKHIYNYPGEYDAVLKVTDNDNSESYDAVKINIIAESNLKIFEISASTVDRRKNQKSEFFIDERIYIFAEIYSEGDPIRRADIDIKIKNSGGEIVREYSGDTNRKGQYSKYIRKYEKDGEYSVEVLAEKEGYADKLETIYFSVK